jgi:NADH-quinone oxidoreductase subunit E
MADNKAKLLSESIRTKIDHWLLRYPPDQKRSGVMESLRFVQEEHGWISEDLLDAVADYLQMPRIAVYEVATFYTAYNLKPAGRHIINLCTNVSCMLYNSEKILTHLKRHLGINVNETTADGKFTLREVECLGACIGAPMMQIGKQYYEHLTPEKVVEILASLE